MLNIYRTSLYSLLGSVLMLMLVFGCSSDSKKEVIHEDLQGLWILTETTYQLLDNGEGNTDPEGEGNTDPEGEGNTDPEGEGNTDPEGEDNSTGEGTPSGVSALSADPGEEDGSQIYPDEEGVQPYLRFGANSFDFFEVRPTDTIFHYADRPYSNSATEINFDIAGTSLLTVGYSIEQNKLVLIRMTEEFEIVHHLEKMSTDPFIPEQEEDEEVSELPENDCSANHNPEAAAGSTANPYLLSMGKDTTVLLIPTTAQNGYETRFYLEVKTAKPYRITISDFSSESGFADVYSRYRYFELSASESFASEYQLFNTMKIHEEDAAGKSADVYPVTSCLYVRLFSYVKDLSVSLRVDPLFEEEEEAADEGEEAADDSEENGTPEA